jgi:hypothetical protein
MASRIRLAEVDREALPSHRKNKNRHVFASCVCDLCYDYQLFSQKMMNNIKNKKSTSWEHPGDSESYRTKFDFDVNSHILFEDFKEIVQEPSVTPAEPSLTHGDRYVFGMSWLFQLCWDPPVSPHIGPTTPIGRVTQG